MQMISLLEPSQTLKALVITHELSEPEQCDDYLPRALAPATPLLVVGRSRDAFPKCKGEECMWYNWKDPRHVVVRLISF